MTTPQVLWQLRVPERARSWNEIWSTPNHRVRTALKDAVFALISGYAWQEFGQEIPPVAKEEYPVGVMVVAQFKSRPVDADNINDKVIIDALVRMGVLENDNPTHVSYAMTSSKSGEEDAFTIFIYKV